MPAPLQQAPSSPQAVATTSSFTPAAAAGDVTLAGVPTPLMGTSSPRAGGAAAVVAAVTAHSASPQALALLSPLPAASLPTAAPGFVLTPLMGTTSSCAGGSVAVA